MPKAAHPRIFISYARKDAADLAQRLQNDLSATGFDVWLDTQRIEGGASWTVAIEEAIDRAQVVLALLTPGAYTSETCRAEQLRSLRTGARHRSGGSGGTSGLPVILETAAKAATAKSDDTVGSPHRPEYT
jgi:hypothetical protein